MNNEGGFQLIQHDVLNGIQDYTQFPSDLIPFHSLTCTHLVENLQQFTYPSRHSKTQSFANILYIGTNLGILIKYNQTEKFIIYASGMIDRSVVKIDTVMLKDPIIIVGLSKDQGDLMQSFSPNLQIL